MRIAVIGANGQLGSDFCRTIEPTELVALTHSEIDVTNLDSIRSALGRYEPEAVINTAAFVRVDDCEVYPDLCFRVNTMGARNVAVVAQELGAKLVHISSDYVFGGKEEKRDIPYTEFDTAVPLNTLGRAKLAGENLVRHLCSRHFIVRVSGLFGVAGSSGKGGNFIETILRLAREKGELRVVNDQIFSPTYTKDAAQKIVQLIATEYYGIFHLTNRGHCSWYEFSVAIVGMAGLGTPVVPITSDQYPMKAKRPHFSVLDNYHLKLLGLDDMRPWQEALEDYMKIKGHLASNR